ncbi:MAG: hypothetical protein L0216_13030 [Planctomycetales bacterium]|nr:hypothetical protein [Planctomycetales bacterium]
MKTTIVVLGMAMFVSRGGADAQEAPGPQPASPPAAPELTDATFKPLLELIRPKPQELGFEEIRWRPTFWEAVLEAQRAERPVLVWAMNGHPLACT